MDKAPAHVVLVTCDSSDDGGKDDAAGPVPRSGPRGSDELFIGADVDGRFTGEQSPAPR